MKLRDRFQNFMTGRYGADELARVYMWITMGLLIVSIFVRIPIFWMLAVALMIYSYYRMFSKNTSKMREQNQKFLNWKYSLAVKKDKNVRRREQKKIYHFYKCPRCKQTVRVPKGRGKICITCPKCRMEFVKKS